MKYIKTFNEANRLKKYLDLDLLNEMFRPLYFRMFKYNYSNSTSIQDIKVPYYSAKISIQASSILKQLVVDIMMAKYGVEIESANFLINTTTVDRLFMMHDVRIIANKEFTMEEIITRFLDVIKNLSNFVSIKYKKHIDKVSVQEHINSGNPERMDLPMIKDILISFTEYVLNNNDSSNTFWKKLGEIVSEKIIKEISDLPDGFKILNTMKKNNPELWKILGQNDIVKMGGEMGGLGF